MAEESDEDPAAIELGSEASDDDIHAGETSGAGPQPTRRQPARKPAPSSTKLEARKSALAERASQLALKQQRKDMENLAGGDYLDRLCCGFASFQAVSMRVFACTMEFTPFHEGHGTWDMSELGPLQDKHLGRMDAVGCQTPMM